MSIELLNIHCFRNIVSARLRPGRHLNLIWGGNAAGKTSFLEAIDCLSRGRSFRTHLGRQLIQKGATDFVLSAKVNKDGPRPLSLGMQRGRSGTRLRVGGERVESLRDFARSLPVQVLHPESHSLIQGPSQQRREYLDWGVFHVEHEFARMWQRYHRALKQRNRGLRAGMAPGLVCGWDAELATLAVYINRVRADYLERLQGRVQVYAQALIKGGALQLDLRPGWDSAQALQDVLRERLAVDRERGFTSAGAHRANLGIRYRDAPAAESASRGEQKLIVAALRLAQLSCLREVSGVNGIFLVDDIGAELDSTNLDRLLTGIIDLGAQAFVSTTREVDLSEYRSFDMKLFHVKHGVFTEVL